MKPCVKCVEHVMRVEHVEHVGFSPETSHSEMLPPEMLPSGAKIPRMNGRVHGQSARFN